jgi:hypothetical protein
LNDGVQVEVTATDKCKYNDKLPNDPAQVPKRGCLKGETEPVIKIATKEVYSRYYGFQVPDQNVSKSRCDENALYSAVGKFFNGLKQATESSATEGQKTMETALSDLQTQTDPRPNAEKPLTNPTPVGTGVAEEPKAPTNDEALQQMLRERYGVPADQAKELVETNPDKVKEMVQKSLSNDVAGATEIAKQLKLNDDVIKNIAQMTPPEQISTDKANEIYRQQQEQRNENTFDPNKVQSGGLAIQCGTDGLAGNIMFAESKCGKINSNPLSSVQGPYHFLCGTWSAYANSTGNSEYANCAYRNDPTISTQVMNAKMDQFASQYGSQCTQAGLSLTSCQYAIHVFGETGYKRVFNAYLSDPNNSAYSLCGAALTMDACTNNVSVFRNGGTVAGVFGELDRRLGGNTTQIGSVSQVSSPLTGFVSGNGAQTYGGSPLSGAGFFDYGNSYSYTTGYSTPTGYSTNSSGSGTSFVSGLFSGLFGSANPTTNQTQVQYGSQGSAQAVASLIAQPQTTYVGSNIVVSWSSVGMRTDRPCITRMVQGAASSTIGMSNEGSVVITASKKGVMKFAITCASLSGQGIVQTASVSVQ